METYQTEEYRGCTINICYDYDCESPRTSDDGNLSHMICFARQYNIGDKHNFSEARDLMERLARDHASYEQIEKYLLEHKGDAWLEKTDEGYTLHDWSSNAYDGDYDEDADMGAIIDQCWDYLSDEDLFNLVEESGELVISTISMLDHSGISVWIGSPTDPWDSGVVGWIYQTKKDTIEQNGGTEENWKEVAWKNMEAEMKEYDAYVEGECFGWEALDEDGEFIDSCWGFIGSNLINEMIDEAKSAIDYHIQQATEKRNNLVSYMTANYDKLPEEQIFVSGDTAYRTDRNNLFKMLQFTSAPIKNNVIGVFDSADFSSVPTVMLECMQSAIKKQSQMQTV